MKRLYLLITIIIIGAHNIMPQDSPFYDAPFGGGGGYTGGWIVPNVGGINVELKNFGVPALPSSGLYTSGGAGFIYLGFIKNLRVGGMGFSGSRTTSAMLDLIYMNNPYPNYYREAVYSISGGGLTLEYTLPFVKNIGVSIGAVIGRGNLNIQLYSNIGTTTWNDYWNSKLNSAFGSSSLKNNYWLFTPTLNIDIPAYYLLSFRIGAGYQYTFGSSWTYDNNKDILNAPTDINGNSFYIQAGIFVGLFSY